MLTTSSMQTKRESDEVFFMETYDVSLAPLYRQFLALRQADLRAIVCTNSQASEVLDEVVDFKDIATEQDLVILDEARSAHAAHEPEQVLTMLPRLGGQRTTRAERGHTTYTSGGVECDLVTIQASLDRRYAQCPRRTDRVPSSIFRPVIRPSGKENF